MFSVNVFTILHLYNLYYIYIVLRNVFWEVLNNATDYHIIVIPKSGRLEQEAGQKEASLQQIHWRYTSIIVPQCSAI